MYPSIASSLKTLVLSLGFVALFALGHGVAKADTVTFTSTGIFNNPGATVSNLTRNADGSVRALNGYTEVLGASGEREIRFALKLFF